MNKEELENKLEENHFKIIQLEEENRNILNSYNCIKKDYIKLTRENNKYKEVLDKIKEFIKEEKEEYEKGKLLYKEFGKELEQYTKGQLVACNHIEKLLEEIE